VLDELKARALPRSSAQCPRPCGAGLLQVAVGAGPAPPPPAPPPRTPDLTLSGLGTLLLSLSAVVWLRRRGA